MICTLCTPNVHDMHVPLGLTYATITAKQETVGNEGRRIRHLYGLMTETAPGDILPKKVHRKTEINKRNNLLGGRNMTLDEILAKNGDVACMQNLVNKNMMEGNFSESFRWASKLAELGDSTAMYILGQHFAMGAGVARDFCKAAEWMRKSAEAGDEDDEKLSIEIQESQRKLYEILINIALEHTNGNKKRAAEILQISRKTLYNIINREQLDV